MKVTQLRWTLCDPIDIQSMEFSRPEYCSGETSLLQGIFPTQGLNPGLPHCGWILYQLSHQGSPLTYYLPKNPVRESRNRHRLENSVWIPRRGGG